jgi:hypothetical protein
MLAAWAAEIDFWDAPGNGHLVFFQREPKKASDHRTALLCDY